MVVPSAVADVASSPASALPTLGQPCAGYLEIVHPGYRRAEHAGEPHVAPADVDPGHPALLVGDRAEMDVDRASADPVFRFATVTTCPDAVDPGPLPVVDRDGAGGAERDPGGLGKLIGPGSKPNDHKIGRQLEAVAAHLGNVAVSPRHMLDLGVGDHLDAHAPHLLGDQFTYVGIESLFHHPRRGDHGDGDVEPLQHLGHLQPDVPGADHNRPFHLPGADGMAGARHPRARSE